MLFIHRRGVILYCGKDTESRCSFLSVKVAFGSVTFGSFGTPLCLCGAIPSDSENLVIYWIGPVGFPDSSRTRHSSYTVGVPGPRGLASVTARGDHLILGGVRSLSLLE